MSDKPFSSYFIADDSSSTVALEDGELKLSNPHTHSWTYALSTTTTGSATITATCKNCAENNNMDFHGGGVTIAAPEAVALIYDGSPKAAAVTVSDDWLGARADNIRITYKQGETALSDAPTDAGPYTAGIMVGEGGGAVTARSIPSHQRNSLTRPLKLLPAVSTTAAQRHPTSPSRTARIPLTRASTQCPTITTSTRAKTPLP